MKTKPLNIWGASIFSQIISILYTEGNKKMIDVSKLLDKTYTYTSKSIDKIESMGIIESRKIGRDRICSLTLKGMKIAQRVKEINLLMNNL